MDAPKKNFLRDPQKPILVLALVLLALGPCIGVSKNPEFCASLSNVNRPKDLSQPGVLIGDVASFRPRLEISQKPLAEIITELAKGEKVFIITDKSSFSRIPNGIPIHVVKAVTTNELSSLGEDPDYRKSTCVIAVGGCTALDAARAVSVGKKLYVIPTVLSTTGISSNRTVIGNGLSSFSYRSATPTKVIVPVMDMLEEPSARLAKGAQSGFGDLFAALSRSLEIALSKEKYGADLIHSQAPEIWNLLTWVNVEFKEFDRVALERLAKEIHQAGLDSIDKDSVQHKVGGEHLFYKVLLEFNPTLRINGPTHGQIVAVGVLLTARIYAQKTNDESYYRSLRMAFDKLGLPTSIQGLEKIGLKREDIERALVFMARDNITWSAIGEGYRNNKDIIDDTFLRGSVRGTIEPMPLPTAVGF